MNPTTLEFRDLIQKSNGNIALTSKGQLFLATQNIEEVRKHNESLDRRSISPSELYTL